jgi:hypothetical protein
MTNAPHLESLEQLRMLYVIYGLGFIGVWGLYAILYWRALHNRKELELTEIELLQTRQSLASNLIYVGVCLLSIVLALTISSAWIPGMIYFLLGPLQGFNGWWHGTKVERLAAVKAG